MTNMRITIAALLVALTGTVQGQSVSATSADPAAARTVADQEMVQHCQMNKAPDGSLQDIWFAGQGVLVTWACGSFRGEIAFNTAYINGDDGDMLVRTAGKTAAHHSGGAGADRHQTARPRQAFSQQADRAA
jgi:hypothetical protein